MKQDLKPLHPEVGSGAASSATDPLQTHKTLACQLAMASVLAIAPERNPNSQVPLSMFNPVPA